MAKARRAQTWRREDRQVELPVDDDDDRAVCLGPTLNPEREERRECGEVHIRSSEQEEQDPEETRRLIRTAQWCRVKQCDVLNVFIVRVYALEQFSRIVQEHKKGGSCGNLGYFHLTLAGHILRVS